LPHFPNIPHLPRPPRTMVSPACHHLSKGQTVLNVAVTIMHPSRPCSYLPYGPCTPTIGITANPVASRGYQSGMSHSLAALIIAPLISTSSILIQFYPGSTPISSPSQIIQGRPSPVSRLKCLTMKSMNFANSSYDFIST